MRERPADDGPLPFILTFSEELPSEEMQPGQTFYTKVERETTDDD